MKGVVFNLLNEMVEEGFGLAAWDTILERAGTEGIYVATDTYADEELVALVGAASELTGIPALELTRSFGEFMIPRFVESYNVFFANHDNLRDFLLTVDQVVHVEVRKLYPEAALPEFQYDADDGGSLTLHYRSPRKLCALAEGLIHGAAAHFGADYQLTHDVCMHNGADHCRLHLQF
ncbi:MAG: heme NO-binding domain-containing protein [Pseudomonadota bacterium]